jgi:hypothetical protein
MQNIVQIHIPMHTMNSFQGWDEYAKECSPVAVFVFDTNYRIMLSSLIREGLN